MTYSDFISECEKRTIEVVIALENEEIESALLERDDKRVVDLLDSEF